MSFKSLIAHNGVVHKKSNFTKKTKPLPTKTKTIIEPNIDSKTVAPESNSSSKNQTVETTRNKTERLTNTEIQTVPNLTYDTLFPGFGESIFTLLIASPFLLFGFKKWLHR